jgi:hypothetical protein
MKKKNLEVYELVHLPAAVIEQVAEQVLAAVMHVGLPLEL